MCGFDTEWSGLVSPLSECDVADGSECDLCGGNENKTTADIRHEMQGLFQVSDEP